MVSAPTTAAGQICRAFARPGKRHSGKRRSAAAGLAPGTRLRRTHAIGPRYARSVARSAFGSLRERRRSLAPRTLAGTRARTLAALAKVAAKSFPAAPRAELAS